MADRGARGVELLLGFGLVLGSAALLLGAIAAAYGIFLLALQVFPTGFTYALMLSATTCLFTPLTKSAWKIAAALWRPFLKYYKYEANSLRPLTDNGDPK